MTGMEPHDASPPPTGATTRPGFDTDLERGMRNRRRILGDAWVDRSIGNASAFTADFQAFITRYAWHEVWGRPGLDAKTRRLLVLVITTALGRWEEFELHCRAALAGGEPDTRISPEELREALIQTAIYAGVPAANTAHAITARLLRELAAGDTPQAADFAAAVAPKSATAATHPGIGRPGRTAGPGPTIAYSLFEPRRPGNAGPAPRHIVLSHALGADRMMWDELAVALSERHHVLVYDHRGHGDSAAPTGPYTLEALADDAARVIDAALPAGTPVVFVGLSLGGMVAQTLALRQPHRVEALVLANTSARLPEGAGAVWAQRIASVEAGGLEAIADATLQRWFTPTFRAAQPATVARIRRRLVSQDAQGYIGCCHAVAGLDLEAGIGAIRCPTLVLAGSEDSGTPPALSEAIAAAITGATCRRLPTAHLSVIEQPDAFAEAVQDFLATLPPGS